MCSYLSFLFDSVIILKWFCYFEFVVAAILAVRLWSLASQRLRRDVSVMFHRVRKFAF